MRESHPRAEQEFKDAYLVEFLDLPESHTVTRQLRYSKDETQLALDLAPAQPSGAPPSSSALPPREPARDWPSATTLAHSLLNHPGGGKNMKKAFASLVLSAALVSAIGCSNWNRNTPASMDNKAIEEEIRKNMLGDHITGLTVDVHDGVVTLSGHLTSENRQKAYDDAAKVNGVKSVVNHIDVP
ncbi:MAG: BON domain-containing protein [Acidobacteriota bacterium]|nr:BON domain-containing protein [Acidobacteriota bacterium]